MTKQNSFSIGDAAKLVGVSQKQLRTWGGRFIPEPERGKKYKKCCLQQNENISWNQNVSIPQNNGTTSW